MAKKTHSILPQARHFYVQYPNIFTLHGAQAVDGVQTIFWNTFLPNYVVEAIPFTTESSHLEYLRIIDPPNFRQHHSITFSQFWIPCLGPVRRLSNHAYIQIVHAAHPELTPPHHMHTPMNFFA